MRNTTSIAERARRNAAQAARRAPKPIIAGDEHPHRAEAAASQPVSGTQIASATA